MTAALEDDFALFDIEEPASSQTTPDWAAAAPPPPTTSTELGPLLGKLSDDTLQSVLVNLAASSLAALSACSHGLRSAVERCVEPACARLFAAAGLSLLSLPERRSSEGAACVVRRAELRTASTRTGTLLAAGHHTALVADPEGGVHLLSDIDDELSCRRLLRLPERVRCVACGAMHALLLLQRGGVLLLESPWRAVGHGGDLIEGAEAQPPPLQSLEEPPPRWTTLVAAAGGEAVASVACGAFHSLLVGASGSLWSAGRNVSGQCGVGHASSPVPASGVGVERVEGLGVRALQASGGGHHSLVLSQGGQASGPTTVATAPTTASPLPPSPPSSPSLPPPPPSPPARLSPPQPPPPITLPPPTVTTSPPPLPRCTPSAATSTEG